MNVNKLKQVRLSVLIEKLTELGWDYSCNRMSRSGMQTYDEIMQYMGIIEETEHWNEDCYADANGDW